jgi:beta-glucosidase
MDMASNIDARVEELISKMSLEEKVGQMNQLSGPNEAYKDLIRQGKLGSLLNVVGADKCNEFQRVAVQESRLGIPLLFGFDVIHGYRTIFSIPLGLASSWDPDLVRKAAGIAAAEARADGINWTFAPMVDIARDPRWGRIAEGAGEDPYLGSVIAKAAVEGFQGEDISDPRRVAACAKHYVGYGAAEGGRDYNTTDMSERTLREIYLPPFKAAVEAGVATIMSAFNDLCGIPASANPLTIREILKGEWGFRGFVVSDWNAIGELINHGLARERRDAAREAVLAGVDMDMCSNCYIDELCDLVRNGAVREEVVDEAVRRILRVKFMLGLFENPYVDPDRARSIILCEEHRENARDIARRSMVLLKNQDGLLPLRKDLRAIAVIGPFADNRADLLGCWSGLGRAEDVVTVLEGIREKISPSTDLLFSDGSNIEEAVTVARKAEVVVLAVGEPAYRSGEGGSVSTIDLPEGQEDLIKAVYGAGRPVVAVLFNGRPLSITWMAERIPAILEAWHPGIQGGNAVADILFGDYNPSGKLPVSFPRTVGQIPVYYNHKNTGRPPEETNRFTSRYIDIPSTPLFPFGYGLSYTRFEYRDLRINPARTPINGKVTVSVEVANVGEREGEEVVQLYIRDVTASITRPVKELKDFKKIHLMPGERKTVEFEIPAERLSFYGRDMKPVVEPGLFKLWIGPNSMEGLEGDFEIV